MEERELIGKVSVTRKKMEFETDPIKKKILQAELLKLNLRLQLLKQTEIIQNLKDK
ncbi:hypothetical protein [Flavobacterium okayamense]|uniref:Transposase n=1 Tax=Flavobacterium okayamense TaxID=2830782 RepID=A0ABM7S857_9FLAO|nr:hypothetical protein [Flavobacterium okayamense]BCY29686.1 hypothetical protein KK2020170_25540 [Flavobacterium okayamense]